MRITLLGSPCGPEILADSPDPQSHRMSQALFCPGCGEVWARIARGPTWYAMSRWCGRSPTCESPHAVPGSFFAVNEYGMDCEDFLQFPAFLAREFKVQIAWAERFPTAGQPASQGELV